MTNFLSPTINLSRQCIRTLALTLGLAILVACAEQSFTANPTQEQKIATTEQSVGMDSGRLSLITESMQRLVDEGLLAGAVTMASRDNIVVHHESVGYRDLETGASMEEDTLFRIYSMTKPITGVALMMLYEEGKFNLSDSVEQYIPELQNLRVFVGIDDEGGMITEAADHKMTIRELMTHTGGLTYGIFDESPVDAAYLDSGVGIAAAGGVLKPGETARDFVAKLGQIPLKHQPGTRWEYSVSVDVQGYLVEVLSGQKFSAFLQERLFDPLQMNDTAFHVPTEKLDRFAQMYVYGPEGNLIASELFPEADFTSPPAFEAGGSGLVSTASDYMRFCQMLLNGGELDGMRILAPLTVAMMYQDHTPKGKEIDVFGTPGIGFGLDFAVVNDPVAAETYSRGEYYWAGAAGTWFWIDPVENLAFVGMIQAAGENLPNMRSTSRRLLYQSITEPRGI